MIRKIVVGFLVFATVSLYAMSLSALNSASKIELMEINGIGEVKAAAIIKERRKGKFKSFEDVQRVEGIGEQTADNIKRGVKTSDGVKKVKKSTKKKTTAKKSKSKKDVEKKVRKTKTKKSKKEKAEKKTKKRKIKSMDEKKKELKTKAKKTKKKKTKTKKEKKTKSKKKN